MARTSRLTDAPDEYARKDEQIFRRELEAKLAELTTQIDRISDGTDTQSSLHSKVESMISGRAAGITTF